MDGEIVVFANRALPRAAKRSLHRMTRAKPLRHAWRAVTAPFGAWTFHAMSVWIWHVPVLFRLALASAPLHILQHAITSHAHAQAVGCRLEVDVARAAACRFGQQCIHDLYDGFATRQRTQVIQRFGEISL